MTNDQTNSDPPRPPVFRMAAGAVESAPGVRVTEADVMREQIAAYIEARAARVRATGTDCVAVLDALASDIRNGFDMPDQAVAA